MTNQTLLIIKPDAIEQSQVGEILTRIETTRLTIRHIESRTPERKRLEAHYEEHSEESFYDALIAYMHDEIIFIVIEGLNAVTTIDKLVGATAPSKAAPGTIRGDLGTDSYAAADAAGRAVENRVHASEDCEAAERELQLWFPEQDFT
jgi:nucleoside-diphosphate kinase